jgi:CheY-like chemotaxis protein
MHLVTCVREGKSEMKTILIVDDNVAVRTMMKIVLNTNGFETLEAENGSVALTLATEKKPDLIISDVMMDNVNGFMLYELLRKDPATRKIPMILITGAAQNSGAWNSEKDVTYFEKPISMHDILNEVKKKLRVTRSVDDFKTKPGVKRSR